MATRRWRSAAWLQRRRSEQQALRHERLAVRPFAIAHAFDDLGRSKAACLMPDAAFRLRVKALCFRATVRAYEVSQVGRQSQPLRLK